MKFLLASSPLVGHVNPVVTVARILKQAGHEAHLSILTRSSRRRSSLPDCGSIHFRKMLITTCEMSMPCFQSKLTTLLRNCYN